MEAATNSDTWRNVFWFHVQGHRVEVASDAGNAEESQNAHIKTTQKVQHVTDETRHKRNNKETAP